MLKKLLTLQGSTPAFSGGNATRFFTSRTSDQAFPPELLSKVERLKAVFPQVKVDTLKKYNRTRELNPEIRISQLLPSSLDPELVTPTLVVILNAIQKELNDRTLSHDQKVAAFGLFTHLKEHHRAFFQLRSSAEISRKIEAQWATTSREGISRPVPMRSGQDTAVNSAESDRELLRDIMTAMADLAISTTSPSQQLIIPHTRLHPDFASFAARHNLYVQENRQGNIRLTYTGALPDGYTIDTIKSMPTLSEDDLIPGVILNIKGREGSDPKHTLLPLHPGCIIQRLAGNQTALLPIENPFSFINNPEITCDPYGDIAITGTTMRRAQETQADHEVLYAVKITPDDPETAYITQNYSSPQPFMTGQQATHADAQGFSVQPNPIGGGQLFLIKVPKSELARGPIFATPYFIGQGNLAAIKITGKASRPVEFISITKTPAKNGVAVAPRSILPPETLARYKGVLRRHHADLTYPPVIKIHPGDKITLTGKRRPKEGAAEGQQRWYILEIDIKTFKATAINLVEGSEQRKIEF